MKKLIVLYSLMLSIGATAQISDTSFSGYTLKFKPKDLIVPGALMSAGSILAIGKGDETLRKEIVEGRNKMMPKFHTTIDNYLIVSPIAIAYGLDAAGFKSKNDLRTRTLLLLKGEFMMIVPMYFLKDWTHQQRPDNTTYNTFPSGHTAQAFAAATFLSEEYKDQFKWMPYAAYGLASSVGVMRMANNRHYISDVLFGAGLGILAMKASYWTHPVKKRRAIREF